MIDFLGTCMRFLHDVSVHDKKHIRASTRKERGRTLSTRLRMGEDIGMEEGGVLDYQLVFFF